ncbi:MAG: type II toxin-antitoxin system ParD family antitoxin [Pseudohongiellaceae bacterium]
MGTTRKTITLTDQQASQDDIEAIRAALIEGEESGEPQPFDVNLFKQEMIAKHGERKS